MAANVVAYPDIALEKFTGLDPSEDAQEFFSLIQRKIQFSLGTRDPADADLQAAYDTRQKALLGSVLRGPAAQWFETLAPGLAWNEVRNQFITRFTDAKDKYRKRIEVESVKRQPDELIKSYTHRVTKAVEKGWPDPDFNNDQRNAKCMEYFVRGLTPPTLKQKAHQRLIENPATTWQQLQDHVATKDLSFSVSSEFTGTASSSIDNKIEIEGLKNQLTEIANLMKDHKINATYNNDNPRFKQNQTRFCKFCKRSGHTIAFCFKYKDFKNENRNPPQQREKFTDNYKRSRSHSPGQQNYKSNNYDNRNSRDRQRNSYSQNQSNYQNNSRSDYRHRSPYPSNSSNNYRSSSYDNRSQERQNNYRNNFYRDNNRQNSRDRQSNGPPRSDNRYRDRSRDHDRDRTPTRQNNNTHSRDNSEGRSPRVHFTSETSRDYYNNENHNDEYLN